MYKYAIEIFYSEEDEGYVAVVPELPVCSAFGETEEAALEEVKIAIELWLETAKKKKDVKYRNLMEKNSSTHSMKIPFAPRDLKRLVYNMRFASALISL
jgi:predicted RNase H-like HicB family nuclease